MNTCYVFISDVNSNLNEDEFLALFAEGTKEQAYALYKAAPDLLAACRSARAEIAIMDVSSLPRYDQEHYLKAIHLLSAAIAKAKGDQCRTE